MSPDRVYLDKEGSMEASEVHMGGSTPHQNSGDLGDNQYVVIRQFPVACGRQWCGSFFICLGCIFAPQITLTKCPI